MSVCAKWSESWLVGQRLRIGHGPDGARDQRDPAHSQRRVYPDQWPNSACSGGQIREIRRLGAGQGSGAPSSMPRHTRRPRRKAVSGAASGRVFTTP